jgi:hypothetical protein
MVSPPKLGPAGSLNSLTPGIIGPNQVSVGTPRNDYASLYWQFTATEDGVVMFDSFLSYGDDDDAVVSNLYVSVVSGEAEYVYPTVTADEYGTTRSGQSGQRWRTETGAVLSVRIQGSSGPLIQHILRVSLYGTERTGPTPDMERTYATGMTNQADYDAWLDERPDSDEFELEPLDAGSTGWGGGSSAGVLQLERAFSGPNPALQSEAIICSWNNSRKGSYGGFWWWSYDGGVDNRLPKGGGPSQIPVCPVMGRVEWGGGEGGAGDWIGFRYSGSGLYGGFWGYSNIEWAVWSVSMARVEFDAIRSWFSELHFAWAAEEFGDPVTGGLNGMGYELTWDDNKVPGNVVDLWLTTSEVAEGGTHTATPGYELSYDAYWSLAEHRPWAPPPYDWGWPMDPAATNAYWPMGQAAAFLARNQFESGYAGGVTRPWTQIPREDIEAAKVLEEDHGVGLMLMAKCDESDSSTPPMPSSTLLTDAAGTVYWLREGMRLPLRPTMEYPDWIVYDYPGFPDATGLGIGGEGKDPRRYFIGRT